MADWISGLSSPEVFTGSWPYNTTNQPPRPTSGDAYWALANEVGGRMGVRELFPQDFDADYRWWLDKKYGVPQVSIGEAQTIRGKASMYGAELAAGCRAIDNLKAKVTDLMSLQSQLGGSEATYMRWLIQDEISQVQRQVALQKRQNIGAWRAMTSQLAKEAEMKGDTERAGELKSWLASSTPVSERPAIKQATATAPPIPDWLKPYIETTGAVPQGGRGQVKSTVAPSTLRPLGAQAELSPDQLGQMAGYQAWTGAGSPTKYSESALIAMSDFSKWWQPYVKQSEELFPSQNKLRTNWATARQ